MLIRKLSIENVRSVLERQEISFDGRISILIGPNGGGKTNILDTLVSMLRRHVFNARHYVPAATPDEPNRWERRFNDNLNSLTFEKHSNARQQGQLVEIELEISAQDVENMRAIQKDASDLRSQLTGLRRKYEPDPWAGVEAWDVSKIAAGCKVTVTWRDGAVLEQAEKPARDFLEYLNVFEEDNGLRALVGKATLQLPMIYLPVTRSAAGFNSSVGLASWNDYDHKRSSDATTSRSGSNIVTLAVGRMAQRFRLLQEDSNVDASTRFRDTKNLQGLSDELAALGYSWELVTVDPLQNSYDVRLTKQGTSFLVGAASSGERELLTYLFAIFALNVRNAVIVVDEPELHLHPRWQAALFELFERLSKTTGNQFVMATHSPTFISPASIQYVSRVYSENQRSNIVRLNAANLPNSKHLFNMVNSENNERVFFADTVVLVEGLHDRIVFERVLDVVAKKYSINAPSVEVVSIGGKGLFPAYQQLLDACKVGWRTVADLDYIEQIGDSSVKALFSLDPGDIKRDVIDNIKSLDGAALVERIDKAMKAGDWTDANDLWAYIKSRRRRLKAGLDEAEQAVLSEFIEKKKGEGIYLLGRGELEDYLPLGYRGKDTQKLIELVSLDDFWDHLQPTPRADLERMAMDFLGVKSDRTDL
ncbi:AAA family ATPase [Bradyrhizobium sp. NAS96.2]|uniref:ATP-dependent nuclease n=1 Tax=Bradyrhizobium sp. NAS96.2 TaxID=1680160 RepID=UPI0009397008|nr:AAA family ATPase [Bradyrhizobium sp. NAS96.2]OKO68909.1 SMC-like protein [Bradyrhizobium sp. NAS96.2]